jgi:alkylation response protein AidB-like acyl-CoA dehydrogenase
MAFIYIPEDKPEEWDLRRIVREKQKQNFGREWIRERVREQLRREMDERVRKYIPDDIEEAIRQLREAGWFPAQQPDPGFGGWVREVFKDIGFLIIFFVLVLLGSIYLGQRTMFYVLSLLLLSIIVVNADKIRRLLELLRVI